MKKFIKSLLIITIIFSPTISKIQADDVIVDPPIVISGCMDSTATNFNPSATVDDGSCTFPTPTTTAPTIIWENPSDITTGTALSAIQLNATSSIPGTFVYSPVEGTILPEGTQTLSVVFTPDDLINYTATSATAIINVIPIPTGGSSEPTLNISTAVDVPTNCNATDIDGVIHKYPEDNSTTSYLAICALKTALDNGSISNVKLSNQYPSLGLFVTTFNETTADPNSQYWALYKNGNYATSGITSMSVMAGDIIMFQLHDFSDNNLGDQIVLNIRSLISNNTNSGGAISLIPPKIKPIFDIKKAFAFLISQQKADGSFGEDLYTDWVTLSLVSNPDNLDQKNKLIKYLNEEKFTGTSITDYERRAMALMALGINPYNGNKINYIKKITDSFDGKQFGDTNKDNDDIFALIVLQNAGYDQKNKILSDGISFILSKQNSNGSWDNSVDLTGASIEALSVLKDVKNVNDALIKAKDYLKNNQKSDGGFGNVSSTTWALEGILALGEKPTDWTNTENTPIDYLTSKQDADGGMKDPNLENRIWQTSYVLASLSNKTWNNIMQKFTAPIFETVPALKKAEIPTLIKSVEKNSIPKTATKVTPKNTENLALENTAAAINAIEKSKPTSEQGWFRKFIYRIFGF